MGRGRTKTGTRSSLAQNSRIATLQGNSQGRGEEALDHQRRRTREFTVANAGRYTTNELLEAVADGAGGFHHKGYDGRTLIRSEPFILMNLLILPGLGRSKRPRGRAKLEG